MSLQLGMAGIFPSISYFQVPGKMSKPVWLMTGTAFIVKPVTERMANKAPLSFLTACHTFAPWKFVKPGPAADSIKIPPEYRRERYVHGRVFLFDENGSSVAGRSVPVNLSAVHPSHDIALLTLPPAECDVFLRWIKERGIDRRFELADAAPGETVTVTGFRGRGVLGDVTLSKLEEYKSWPKEKVEAMMKEMQVIEGKQDAFTYAVKIDSPNGGESMHGRGFSGMSGAPLLNKRDQCTGMLLGVGNSVDTDPNEMNRTQFVPASTIREWCESLFKPMEELPAETLPPGDLSSLGIKITPAE